MSEALTPSYPSRLDFQGISLRVIDHEGRPWLTAADLARALGYSDERSVTRIYRRHQDEFTEEMTQVVKLTTSVDHGGELQREVRIFSSRGCYLIAMFARTPVAKAFRKWVLDVLEKLEREGRVELRKRPALPETVEERLKLAERIVQGLRRLDLLDDQARLLYQEVAINALAQLTGKTEPVDLG